MNPDILDKPTEILEDIIGLCNKVAHDNEVDRYVMIVDLVELRDTIDKMRRHLATAGFKTIPKLKKSDP